MAGRPGHGLQAGQPGLEERLALGGDRRALFGADDEGTNALAGDAALVGEGIPVQQLHQPHELIGFALVGRGAQQQQVRGRLGQRRAQLVTRDLVGAAAHAMGLVDDHQVPAGGHQVFEAVAVVQRHLLAAPAPPAIDGLHRIQGTDDLVMGAPEVLFLGAPLFEGRQIGTFDVLQALAEVQPHFRLPLANQPLRRHDQDALDAATKLQLTQHQPGFDGLAQADFVRAQVPDAIPTHGPVQRVELVRQGHDAALDRGQQQVVLQRVLQLGGGHGMQHLVGGGLNRLQGCQLVSPRTKDSVLARKPDAEADLAPHVQAIDHTAGLRLPGHPTPVANVEGRVHGRQLTPRLPPESGPGRTRAAASRLPAALLRGSSEPP